MEKRPMVWMFSACIIGMAAAFKALPLMLLPPLIFGSFLFWKKTGLRGIVVVCCVLMVVAYLRERSYDQRYQRLTEALLQWETEEKETEIQGLIIQTKESEKSYQYRIHHCRLRTETAVLSIPDTIVYQSKQQTEKPLSEGTYVYACGVYTMPQKPRNDGGFDEAAYDYSAGILGKMFPVELRISNHFMGKHPLQFMEGAFYRVAWWVKCSTMQTYQKVLSGEEAQLVPAICLGKKDAVSKELQQRFRESGISHVLAISGLHIGIVGVMALSLLKRGNFSLNCSSVIGFLAVMLFAMATGGASSALRAAIMFGVYLGSIRIGRSYDGLSAMALAGMLLLLWEPEQLFGASFQFSFAAVSGVFVGIEWMNRKYKKLHPLFQTLWISGFLFLVTFPLVWWYQWQVAGFSMLLNILVIPLMGPLLGLGLFGGLLNMIHIPILPDICVRLSGVAAKIIAWLAEHYLSVPGGHPVIGHPTVWMLIAYLLIFLSAFVWGYSKKNFLTMLAPLIFIMLVVILPKMGKNTLTFLDVGQGDGIVMETKEGLTLMVDGGSTDEEALGTYTILPYLTYHGKKRVDLWFVSHLDEDHISGLLELLEKGYPIGRLCFHDAVKKDMRFTAMQAMAKKRRIPISFLQNGQSLSLGSLQITAFGRESEDPNDSSLTLLARYYKQKVSFWLGGDISTSVEEAMALEVAKERRKEDALFMKADHHGSDYSNSEALLRALTPEGVVISCGKNNRYGHPGKEALMRMKNAGIPYVVTMDTGQVTVDCMTKKATLGKRGKM